MTRHLLCMALSAMMAIVVKAQVTGKIYGRQEYTDWTMYVCLNNQDYSCCAFQMDVTLPAGVTPVEIHPATSRLVQGDSLIVCEENVSSEFVISFNCINTGNNTFRLIAYNLANNVIKGTGGNPILKIDLHADEAKKITSMSADLSNVVFVNTNDLSAIKFDAEQASGGLLGDANKSGNVDVSDILAIVNYIFEDSQPNFDALAADVNENECLNVADITGVVSIIYGIYPDRNLANAVMPITPEFTFTSVETIIGQTIEIPVYADNPSQFSSFQFDVNLPEGMILNSVQLSPQAANKHSCRGAYVKGAYRVVSYSAGNAYYDCGSNPIAVLNVTVADNMEEGTYPISISNIYVSTARDEITPLVHECSITVNSPATSIVNPTYRSRTAGIYSLSGIQFNKDASSQKGFPKGIYIMNGKKILK